jgi:hypothetical protein
MSRGDVFERGLPGQHALDVGQAHPEFAQRPHQPRPRDRVGAEVPVARPGAPGLREHTRVGVKPQRPHRYPGTGRKLADRHGIHCAVSTRWRVKPGRARPLIMASSGAGQPKMPPQL